MAPCSGLFHGIGQTMCDRAGKSTCGATPPWLAQRAMPVGEPVRIFSQNQMVEQTRRNAVAQTRRNAAAAAEVATDPRALSGMRLRMSPEHPSAWYPGVCYFAGLFEPSRLGSSSCSRQYNASSRNCGKTSIRIVVNMSTSYVGLCMEGTRQPADSFHKVRVTWEEAR